MKQKYFLKFILTGLLSLFSLCLSFGQVIITELADPNNSSVSSNKRYVEIYNQGDTSIDLN